LPARGLSLLAERLELGVASPRGLDGRQEVGLAERLDEVAENTRLDRTRDELVLAVGSQHHNRNGALSEDPAGRFDAVEARHLDVQDREIGRLAPRELHRLLAVLRRSTDHEPRRLEDLLEIESDDGLVLGDQDPKRHQLRGI